MAIADRWAIVALRQRNFARPAQNVACMATRMPRLGPRGEGWVGLQLVLFGLIALAGLFELRGRPDAFGVRELAGGLVGGVGALIAAWSAWELRHELTPFPRPIPGNQLVESGTYRWVRHPIYSGIVLVGLGWSLLTGSWIAFLLCLILAALFDAKSRREEAWLAEQHPDYADYRRRTRRFVPGVY